MGPIPFRHGKVTVFKLGTFAAPATVVDLSQYFTNIELTRATDVADATGFLAPNKLWVVGIPDFALALTGLWDAVPDAQLAALNGTEVAPNFEFGPEGSAAGRVKYSGTGFVSGYNVTNPVAGVVATTASLVAASAITRGVWP